METDITQHGTRSKRNAERLDRPVKVLVVNRVFVMPNAGRCLCNLISYKCDSIVARIADAGGKSTVARAVPSV